MTMERSNMATAQHWRGYTLGEGVWHYDVEVSIEAVEEALGRGLTTAEVDTWIDANRARLDDIALAKIRSGELGKHKHVRIELDDLRS
jgi:hypothetical protein